MYVVLCFASCLFKQANYNEIKNFIQVIVFDGEEILFSENKDVLFCVKAGFVSLLLHIYF